MRTYRTSVTPFYTLIYVMKSRVEACGLCWLILKVSQFYNLANVYMFMNKNHMQLFPFKVFCMIKLVAIVSVVCNSKQLCREHCSTKFSFLCPRMLKWENLRGRETYHSILYMKSFIMASLFIRFSRLWNVADVLPDVWSCYWMLTTLHSACLWSPFKQMRGHKSIKAMSRTLLIRFFPVHH